MGTRIHVSRAVLGLAGVILLGLAVPAPAQETTLVNFEGAAAGTNSYLFRQPSFSGTTDDNLNGFGTTIAPNIQQATDTFPAGLATAGTRVGFTQFQFLDGTNSRWLRHTTNGAAGFSNPVIDLSKPFTFDIYGTQPMRVTLLIRETGNAPVLSNGGVTGSIEYVGATALRGAASGASAGPVGKLMPANTWTTLTFNPLSESVQGFTGNGVLEPSNGSYGVLEALGFTSEGNAGPYNVYYDNFRSGTAVPEPASLAALALGGLLWATRRKR